MRPAKAHSEQGNKQPSPLPIACNGYRVHNGRFQRLVTLAIIGWGLAVVACSAAIIWSSRQPGAIGQSPNRLPALSDLSPIPGSTTLIIAVHPHCPCTHATVVNLERVLQSAQASCTTVALLYTPHEQGKTWSDTELVNQLSRLPNTRLVRDDDGRTAAQIGMHTSGQVLFYDAGGALRFAGGITQSRGHEGDCEPLEQLTALLAGRRPTDSSSGPAVASVFGCPLCNEGASSVCSPMTSNEP